VAGWSSEIDSGTAAAVLDGFDGAVVGVCTGVDAGVEAGVEAGVGGGVVTGVDESAATGVLVTGRAGSGSANAPVGISPISNIAAAAVAPGIRKFMAVLPLRRSPSSSRYLLRCFHYRGRHSPAKGCSIPATA
jgi:hypothetical protein